MKEPSSSIATLSFAALVALAATWTGDSSAQAQARASDFVAAHPSVLIEAASTAEVEKLGEIASSLGYRTLCYELRPDGLWIMKLLVPISLGSAAPPPPPPLPECPGRTAAAPFHLERPIEQKAV